MEKGRTTGAESRFLEMRARSKILLEENSVADSKGTFARKRVYETASGHGLVRMEQTIQLDSDGAEEIRQQVLMAADHIMVNLLTGTSTERFAAFLDKHHATLGQQIRGTQVFLVHFDGTQDLSKMEQLLDALKGSGMVSEPEPDFIQFVI